MKFGKVASSDLDEIDFKLPALSARSEAFLKGKPSVHKPELYFGATGWGMPEWVGSYYPPKVARKNFLYHYARQFNSLEFNSTHYRIPKPEQVQEWKAQVPERFRFGPKIPQRISHSKDLDAADKHCSLFCASIVELSAHLGHCFMQLPPYFGRERFPILQQFLERFPLNDIPLAVEFRHPSWFEGNQSAVFDFLAEKGCATVITDVAGRRDILHQEICSDTLMLRFVGNDLHTTDFERLDAWMQSLSEWTDKGLRRIYAFLHEPDNIRVPELATYFVKAANKTWDLNLKPPKRYENPQQQLF